MQKDKALLKLQAQEFISKNPSAINKIPPADIQQLIEDHRNNRVDGTDRLLSLLNLEIWSRIYIDGMSPEDVSADLSRNAA